jgi:fatty-acyl-CoA synthase
MSEKQQGNASQAGGSAAKAWLRALELTTPIARNRDRILPVAIKQAAAQYGDAPALLSDRETLSYRGLAARANQYARWALDHGLAKGDVACLLMTNRPEYFAIWLGLTSVGVVVSLLNTNLSGASLAHCIRAASPKHIVASAEFIEALSTALPLLDQSPLVSIYGANDASIARIDLDLAHYSVDPLSKEERRETNIDDLALLIYTSGTTGLPKAAKVSHARVMQWTHWFAGMMEVQPSDRMYNCLPMYHSVGGVQAPGAMLAGGGAVVIREKFSASQFWSDIVGWDCTLLQYIGELCRYLLHTPPCVEETAHRIRLACGNGLSAEVWDAFKDRFRIPRILEFYAATEANVSLFNVEGKRGAIGHIPPYLEHRFSPALVVFDAETGEPARNVQGFCIVSAPNQPGEALSKIATDTTNIGSRFEGYTATEATERKILRNVFAVGDEWVRTGDLMRRDEKGFFYFVDRIGDTFRRKGENVAASEVAEAICAFPGIEHANVYGVAVPGTEGRVGMAAVVAGGELDLPQFRKHLGGALPAYARPVFLRIRKQIDLTGTFKYSKTELLSQAYDPQASTDPIYFDNQESDAFVPLDSELYRRINDGAIRL